MVLYILSAYHVHDEEIEALHLPLSFIAILEALVVSIRSQSCTRLKRLMSQSRVKSDPAQLSRTSSTETLALLHEMSKYLHMAYLKQWPQIGGEAVGPPSNQSAYALASTVYGRDCLPEIAVEREPTSPLITVFDDMIKLSMYSDMVLASSATDITSRETFAQCLILLRKLASQLQANGEPPVPISWNPYVWLSAVVQCIQSEVFVFVL
jgi:hypothetical protein